MEQLDQRINGGDRQYALRIHATAESDRDDPCGAQVDFEALKQANYWWRDPQNRSFIYYHVLHKTPAATTTTPTTTSVLSKKGRKGPAATASVDVPVVRFSPRNMRVDAYGGTTGGDDSSSIAAPKTSQPKNLKLATTDIRMFFGGTQKSNEIVEDDLVADPADGTEVSEGSDTMSDSGSTSLRGDCTFATTR